MAQTAIVTQDFVALLGHVEEVRKIIKNKTKTKKRKERRGRRRRRRRDEEKEKEDDAAKCK